MASLSQLIPGGFNSQAVEPQAPRDDAPLPPGLYSAEITNAEVKPLKSGTGQGLNLEFTIIDPEQYARRKVWQLLCIVHENAQTKEIAQAQLSALCRAVGIGVLDDTDQLFQRIVKIRTKVRPAQGNYGPKAEVSGFEPAGTALPPTPNKPTTPAPAAAKAAAKAAPPWFRKAA